MRRTLRLTLEYGSHSLRVRVPNAARVEVVSPKEIPDSAVDLASALESPASGPPLSELLRGSRRVLVIVNDATRLTPTVEMLDAVMPRLEGRDVWCAVATGAHDPPTDDDLEAILGPHLPTLRSRLVVHRARDLAGEPSAVTSYGTPVLVNEAVNEADLVLALTAVEPHYMAGFAGGRKSVVPGLAAYRTIEGNHRLAIREGSEPLRLEGNPLNEDLEEAVDLLDAGVFCVNGVLDGEGTLVHVSCGPPRESLRKAADASENIYAPQVEEHADVAVAAANFPLDRDLYQAQKAIENVAGAVSDGGILILVSRCWDGIGPRHYVETLEDLATDALDPEAVFQSYRLGHHKPVRMARLLKRLQVWGVTEAPPDALRRAMVQPFATLQEALDEAFAIHGGDARVLWAPKASVTVPVLR